MAREVTHEATGPLRIDEAELVERGGSVMLCRCGLSSEYPFCDGSHEATRDEDEGRLYRYDGDGDGDRREIAEVVVVDGDDENGDDASDVEDPGEAGDRDD
jgi:CDGSH-type Zn-finger protein